MLGFILPRLVPALILAGLMQVLVPQEIVARHFGREGGLRGLVIAAFAGVLTPGGPMVTVPFMVALANSGAAMPPLVAYMTSWSLFGMQRIPSNPPAPRSSAAEAIRSRIEQGLREQK